ncbi:VPLPA-CTERM sorting domain-containing protein [Ovoidimarina sediminis]|uniref:VPLPA-CTERM sorting domain-containing protein n=1 Tax=Ovoidimarina sediminis TaxID=3079856 RepID=UPI002912978B|nr:VPLPA-CTERM sorting domain-containing protein [Rhodophyticola sp. MJ-SS7]MDU8946610.1 VPLPA-CTERM sorting domain-containing protein [Rhodophyticola sp. MJ-SS7]
MGYINKGSVSLALGLALFASSVSAATFFGPTPYTSEADIPDGLYDGGATFIETFEDLSLDGGITASAGAPYSASNTDSVDADDGSIDGSGLAGSSFFSGSGATGITFTFDTAVTAAGLVWTDGFGTITFSAFDATSTLIFTDTFTGIPDGTFGGTTGDDRFFGISDLGGIGSLFISNSSGGIEIDHIQYGVAANGSDPGPAPIPVPAAFSLLLTGLGAFAVAARGRRRCRSH